MVIVTQWTCEPSPSELRTAGTCRAGSTRQWPLERYRLFPASASTLKTSGIHFSPNCAETGELEQLTKYISSVNSNLISFINFLNKHS